jgi:hypothetical protein
MDYKSKHYEDVPQVWVASADGVGTNLPYGVWVPDQRTGFPEDWIASFPTRDQATAYCVAEGPTGGTGFDPAWLVGIGDDLERAVQPVAMPIDYGFELAQSYAFEYDKAMQFLVSMRFDLAGQLPPDLLWFEKRESYSQATLSPLGLIKIYVDRAATLRELPPVAPSRPRRALRIR